MSDYYIKIIPAGSDRRISPQTADRAVKYLQSCIIAYSVEAHIYETPAFVDCGGYLQDISCPYCGKSLFTEWWTEAMNKAYENNFRKLDIKTPCCNKDSSLNELQYDFPCGFACAEIDIMNPREELMEECIIEVEKLMNTPVRIIYSRV
ncbi:MAG: hypothetical protein J6C19_09400 [Lachnospiraceae bacterium]|nr:hypothetical protein [Lachnospiraceae bacterium]MBO5145730.1 hypothetical protein [Lachnospiraceae bacterium]